MDIETNFEKIEALKQLVSRLTFRLIEVQSTLSELNGVLGDPIPYERKFTLDSFKRKNKEPEQQDAKDTPVIFEKFPDGTAEGITLPILIGKNEDGEPIYF